MFTIAPSDTVAFGVAFSFAVTASGSPAPRITKSGPLPPGVKFTHGKDGTATISGTPKRAADGKYALTLTAKNKSKYALTLTAKNKSGTATQAFTLTVTRTPAIKKIPATRATVGVALSLAITATGYPAPALTESGALPVGLTFTDHGNGTAFLAGTRSRAAAAIIRSRWPLPTAWVAPVRRSP